MTHATQARFARWALIAASAMKARIERAGFEEDFMDGAASLRKVLPDGNEVVLVDADNQSQLPESLATTVSAYEYDANGDQVWCREEWGSLYDVLAFFSGHPRALLRSVSPE